MPHKDTFQNPWPRSDAYVQVDRRDRGEYYGYYHEIMDRERINRRAELPDSMKIDALEVPKLGSGIQSSMQ